MKKVSGGATAPMGFLAAGVKAGIKHSRPDLALLVSESSARAAAVYTQNVVKGDHVALCQKHLSNGKARAIVVNSGCANACVGPRGAKDALAMAELTSSALGVPGSEVLVCSTGTIGIPLPMPKISAGIKEAAKRMRRSGGAAASKAIMTTDTHPKQYAVELTISGKKVRIGGMAKGSGMIEPNMATMLAFITTDANVSSSALRKCLSASSNETFNRISVDGDQSCNDTVILMANGAAGTPLLTPRHSEWIKFQRAVDRVCRELAVMLVKDGEGATKFVKVQVTAARTQAEARAATRAIANSLLVKTSWFGGDPNWGRIIDAAGYSGARFDPRKTSITFNGVAAVRNGCRSKGVSLKTLEKIYRKKELEIEVNLKAGKASHFVFTCDCSFDYVRINSEYMT
jgi:glutamate N-acetyltransferase/amino-acid N-acetyltransferase